MRRAASNTLGWLIAVGLAIGARAWLHVFTDTVRGR